MKRVVLTGGTGFVGANLARRLLRDGHAVHLLVRPGHNAWRIEDIRHDVELHEVDITEAVSVAATIQKLRPEWVFHLAAHGAYSWQKDFPEIVRTNVLGTVNLVNACLATGFESFIHTGTSSEYGVKDHAPMETEWIEPNSCYAVTKASATLYCRHVAQSQRANIITLRLYSTFGPYEDPNRLFPTLIARGLKGELPPLVDPNTPHDFVYVDDVCDASVLAAQTQPHEFGTVYNVGTGIQTTLQEVVEIARRLMGISAQPQWGSMPARAWDVSVWLADNRKIRTELGWQPRFTFEQGFQQMVTWLRQQSA